MSGSAHESWQVHPDKFCTDLSAYIALFIEDSSIQNSLLLCPFSSPYLHYALPLAQVEGLHQLTLGHYAQLSAWACMFLEKN